jgi:tetratricopeptide (TPR) repeat protein
VRLTVPLDRSLAARKKSLEAALAAYGRASDYAVAPVTTAATFAMADLYRDFGRALMNSERPRNLSAEELEQYDLLLEEQAFPFEEKAIGIHERNARRATEGVYDESVRKSYAALAELEPGRFARAEQDAGELAPALDVAAVEAQWASHASVATGEPAAISAPIARAASKKQAPARATGVADDPAAGVTADPAAAAHFNRLGIARRQAGRFAESRTAYEQAIFADPGNAEAERNLAILLDLYLGQSAEALPHYERSQSLAGEGDGEIGKWVAELRTRLGRNQRTAEARE